MKKCAGIFLSLLAALLVWSCSTSRHVPQDRLLLSDVRIDIDGKADVSALELATYLRQQPNHKVLGFAKLSLGIYNLSGRDTTRWYNKWARSLGQEPVIYDSDLTELSRRQLLQTLVNRGYTNASVTVDSVVDRRKRKINLTYHVRPGEPFVISTIDYDLDDPATADIVMEAIQVRSVEPGTLLDRDLLEAERVRIANLLRDHGYYAFNKEYITFTADTAAGSRLVDLTMHLERPKLPSATAAAQDAAAAPEAVHRRYVIEGVRFVVESPDEKADAARDTVWESGGYSFVYGPDRYLRPGALIQKCFIVPGEPYNATAVARTYEALAQFGILKYVNITFHEAASVASDPDADIPLEAVVTVSRTKKQSVSFEVEGTNSEGDLGFGVGLTYRHRNLFHGSELLSARIRTSYESLSGDLDGLINDRYTEVGAEVGITFPKFVAPFVSEAGKKRRLRAATEFAVSFNYQERPEYTRIISGAAWKYKWGNPSNTRRQTFDLVDLNLVYLPRHTIDFLNNIAPTNPLLRYSYEDHLIMRMGYSSYHTNRRSVSPTASRFASRYMQTSVYTLRWSVETAGNFLYALSWALGLKREDGAYKVFGTQFAQYAKGEIDYAYLYRLSSRLAIASHAGFGIGVPYGNSSMIPFEKRFYAGGANSVRGWGVRTLGPGSYDSRNSVTDFINQCGDIRLDLSTELRCKLFWVVEGALFIDAGNIWTIRSYPNQPGGVWRFDKFWKQIALGYGVGVRLDFDYFILRLDMGMKAHNPAMGAEPWPLIHPRWGRDHAFHFSIGYPF